jgi:putative FmdB family regulatory protein
VEGVSVPTYQYSCTACDHRLEAVQSFSDPALTQCPQCSGTLRKLFSSVGIVFKGSGFYRTDSRSAAGASNGSGSANDSAAGDKSSSDKSTGDKSTGDKSGEKAADKAPAASGSGSKSGSGDKAGASSGAAKAAATSA